VRCETNRLAGAIVRDCRACVRNICQEPSEVNTSREPELQVPRSSVWRILHKRLCMRGYWLQLLQALNPQDHNLHFHFCVDFQQWLEEDGFTEKLVFSDEATFHVCGKVNLHNIHIWGTENPHAMMEHIRDSPKVNVFCAISSCKVYAPFFFVEPTVNGINYLDTLQLWLMPQLQEDGKDFIFQKEGAPPHFHFDVCAHHNANLPGRWIGLASHSDSPLLTWPLQSLDLTPCNVFLWGYIKDRVYVPPMPRDLSQLRQRIVEAVAAIYCQMLQCVWQELDYRIDIPPCHQGWTYRAPVR